MSDSTHEQADPNATPGPIKTPTQLFWVSLGGFAVPILISMGLAIWINSAPKTSPGETGAAEKVLARIQKVGTVEIRAGGPAPAEAAAPAAGEQAAAAPAAAPAPAPTETAAAAPAAEAPAAAAAPGKADLAVGKALYEKACIACHGTGVAGAPKVGDHAAWAPRIAEGMDAMMNIAIHGKGAMPPRGATTATDAELFDAVSYMADASK